MDEITTPSANTPSPLGAAELKQRLLAEAARVNRYGGELGIIFFALDEPEGFFEPDGRGDKLLEHLSAYVSRRIRAHDIFGRWGDTEFAVLVPATELTEITGFAVKLRRLVDEYQFNGAGPVTASFGVTEFRRGEPVENLERRAARALERARVAGGNRIVAARAEE